MFLALKLQFEQDSVGKHSSFSPLVLTRATQWQIYERLIHSCVWWLILAVRFSRAVALNIIMYPLHMFWAFFQNGGSHHLSLVPSLIVSRKSWVETASPFLLTLQLSSSCENNNARSRYLREQNGLHSQRIVII